MACAKKRWLIEVIASEFDEFDQITIRVSRSIIIIIICIHPSQSTAWPSKQLLKGKKIGKIFFNAIFNSTNVNIS